MTPGLDEGDLVFAETLAEPAALAIDNARWFQAEKAGRVAALEEADRERHDRVEAQKGVLRLRRLESISASLASTLSPHAIARVAMENGLSALEPSTATVAAGRARGQRARDAARPGLARRPDGRPPAAADRRAGADHRGVPDPDGHLGAGPEALAQSYPNAAELALRVGDKAWCAVPLRCDGRTAARSGWASAPARLDADEKRFVLAVAQQVAQALERARLRDEAR